MDPTIKLLLANHRIRDAHREAAADRLAAARPEPPAPPRGPLTLVARVGASIASGVARTRLA